MLAKLPIHRTSRYYVRKIISVVIPIAGVVYLSEFVSFGNKFVLYVCQSNHSWRSTKCTCRYLGESRFCW